MTNYILAGGKDRGTSNYASDLSKVVETPKYLLSCFFAQPRENWEDKFASFEDFFRNVFGADCEIELAFPDDFRQQVKKSEVIYLHGGDDTLITYYLDVFKDISTMFEGKTVIGSSAGANYLSSKYWTCDWREVREGSGLVPLNIITHYGSHYGSDDPRGAVDWVGASQELLKATQPDHVVTTLPEGKFVFYQT